MDKLKINTPLFSNELYMLIYGKDVNLTEIKMKDSTEVWNDIIFYLAKGDFSKIEEIKQMKLTKVLEFLSFEIHLLFNK